MICGPLPINKISYVSMMTQPLMNARAVEHTRVSAYDDSVPSVVIAGGTNWSIDKYRFVGVRATGLGRRIVNH